MMGAVRASHQPEPHQRERGKTTAASCPAVTRSLFEFEDALPSEPKRPSARSMYVNSPCSARLPQRCAQSLYVNAAAYPRRSSHLPELWRSRVTLCCPASFPPLSGTRRSGCAWDAGVKVKKTARPGVVLHPLNHSDYTYSTHHQLRHIANL